MLMLFSFRYKEFLKKLDALTVKQTSDGRGKGKGRLKPKPEQDWKVMKKKLTKETENIVKREECDRLGKPKFPKNSFLLYLSSLNQDEIKCKVCYNCYIIILVFILCTSFCMNTR